MRDLYISAIKSVREVSLRRIPEGHVLTDDTDDFIPRLNLPHPQPLPGADTRRILVADDNYDTVESLSLLLELEGHKVYGTHDGVGALRLAKALKPDFLLLDIAMPHINGYEVARQIRSSPWGLDLQIIAITGSVRPEDRARALIAGCDFHLTKPIRVDVLNGILATRGAAFAAP